MSQIGFVLSHEQFPVPQLIELGIAAEQAGFDNVWASDHFHPWMDNQGHAGQAWITLAALGQRTQKIRFGTGVTCPTYRYHPTIVAQTFATLGLLYPGRVFLGVGSGEALNELAATGEWGDYKERTARLLEAIELIRQLWTGNWVTHTGQYYPVGQVRLYDLPAQPVPIYIAASGPKSTYKAGLHGDGLISDSASVQKSELRQAFEEGAQAAGKAPKALPILAEHFVVVGGQQEAKEAAAKWRFIPEAWSKFVNNPDPRSILQQAEAEIADDKVTSQWLVSDDPEVHAQSIRQLFDAGVTEIYVHSGQADQMRVVNFYGQEVIPRLRR